MEVAAPVLNQGMEPLELEACRRGVSLLTGDRYDVIRPLGRGGMSVVLLGLDRQEGRRVALKLLDPAQGASVENRERFRREALISPSSSIPTSFPATSSFITTGSRSQSCATSPAAPWPSGWAMTAG
jgi:serine/threonine protein kinase